MVPWLTLNESIAYMMLSICRKPLYMHNITTPTSKSSKSWTTWLNDVGFLLLTSNNNSYVVQWVKVLEYLSADGRKVIQDLDQEFISLARYLLIPMHKAFISLKPL